MSEFFSEKLQTPVEFFNPLRNVTVSDASVAEKLSSKAHTVGELVGTALRALGDCPIEINLRPPNVVREQDLARRKPFLVMAVACFLLSLVAAWLYLGRATTVTEEVLAKVQADVAQLKGVADQIDKITGQKKNLEALSAPLLLAAAERSMWAGILDELGTKIPPRFIWITQIEPLVDGKPIVPSSKAGSPASSSAQPPQAPPRPGQAPAGPPAITALQIQGLYLDNPPNEKEARIIDEFVENLRESQVFAIGDDKNKVIIQRTTPTGESWAYSYTLNLPLRNPILIP
jgi:hypothetical protein